MATNSIINVKNMPKTIYNTRQILGVIYYETSIIMIGIDIMKEAINLTYRG